VEFLQANSWAVSQTKMEFKMSTFTKRFSTSILLAAGVTLGALGLSMTLCASANAATLHHHRARHHVVIPPGVASSFAAAPGWSYGPPSMTDRYDDTPDFDTPSYNDPSKSGGSTALPIQN
jgi:hypothetical protein